MGATLRMLALFAGLMLIFTAIGYLLGTLFFKNWILGSLFFLGIAVLINFISYFWSDKIVLWSYGAKIVSQAEYPRLYKVVTDVCMRADLPMPRIAIVPTKTPNAFATGRNKNNAVVAVTDGIMSLLPDDELAGVLAHEMAHIKDRDMLVMTVAATIAGAVAFASRIAFYGSFGRGRSNNGGNAIILLLAAITAPIAALLLRLAISRSREYKADKEGSLIIQRPLALARALEKLEDANRRRPMDRGSPTSASLFIVNPFNGGGLVTIFMTHPPITSRVKRLRQLADQTGYLG